LAQETLILKVETSASERKLNRFHKSMMAFDNKVKSLQGTLRKFERVSKRSWEKFGNHVRRARRRVQVATAKMKKALLSLKGVLTGLAIGAFVRQIFTAAATMERFRLQLTTLTGSSAKAKQVLDDLQKVNLKSPFELPELVKAATTLKAYGVETSNLVDMTERLGKISAATQSDVDGIAMAYGQARAKGKLMAEELRQFINRGVPVREELEKLTGITGGAFDDAMRKGQITFAMLQEAIVDMTGETGKFGNAFENTANSLDTKLSNMQDAFFRASAALGKAFEPVFKWLLDSLTAIFNFFIKMMNGIQRNLDAIGDRLKAGQNTSERLKEMGYTGSRKRNMPANLQSDIYNEEFNKLQKAREGTGLEAELPKLVNGVNSLGEATDRVSVKWESIRETIASGLTSAIEGLIDGTKSLGESLAGIAKSIASMYLKSAITSMLPGLPASSEGRYASSPMVSTLAEKGEPEYVIPAGRMAEASSRYNSGMRGDAVIPRGGGTSNSGSGGGTTVNYSGPILNFNSEEFVPKSAIGEIINSAASRGAAVGESRTIASLKNSRSRRSTLGL
jgi:tape measure domain-containing protein